MKKIILLSFLFSVFNSCKEPNPNPYNENESNYESVDESSSYTDKEYDYIEDEGEAFEDGGYWATVDYYNPSTGHMATYTLEVEVEDNEVTTIYFPNDGYLDEDHIWAEELDEDGYANVQGEEGKTYEVQIDR